jgi:hypothetical protein
LTHPHTSFFIPGGLPVLGVLPFAKTWPVQRPPGPDEENAKVFTMNEAARDHSTVPISVQGLASDSRFTDKIGKRKSSF